MTEYTVKQFAAQEGVTKWTVYLWIRKGAVVIRKTPGGGIRIIERRAVERESVRHSGPSLGILSTTP